MQDDIAQNARNINELHVRIQMIEDSAANAKPWWLSKGIIGGLGAVAAPVAAIIMLQLNFDKETIMWVLGLAGGSGMLSTIGRAVAKVGVK